MSAPRKTKRKAQEVSISISEFKQWLAGVEDMQEDGWVPDAVQWAKIRAKVELLADEEVQLEQYQNPPAYGPNPNFVPGAPIPYHPPAQQDYMSLSQANPPIHRPQPAMLLDDGIMMPSKIPQESTFDSAGGLVHATDSFS